MFSIEMFSRAVENEELRGICVLPFISHADGPAGVVFQGTVEFIFERGGPDAGSAAAGARGVAALDHEVGDVAVEFGGVVVSPVR